MGLLDNKGPEISNVTYTPNYPTPLDKLNVTARITDPDGVQSAYLFYCNKTNCFPPKTMALLGNDIYFATIDLSIFHAGDMIDVDVTCTDTLGNSSTTPKQYINISRVPNSLNVTLSLNKGMCAPNANVTATCTATFDTGVPAVNAKVNITIIGTNNIWITSTNGSGGAGINITTPKSDGTYYVNANVSIGNYSGFSKAKIVVTSKPTAPDFDFTSIDGVKFKLADYHGKVVLLDFMSLICTSCKRIEDSLLAIYPNYKGKDVVFITVDISPTETDSQLQAHRTSTNISWIITRAPDGLVDAYGVTEIPVVTIINRDGYITFSEEGILSSFDQDRNKIISDQIDGALAGGKPVQVNTVFLGFIGVAIFMGVAAFFSPCSFPLLPGYISYYLGMNKGDPSKDDDDKSKSKKKSANFAFAVKSGIASALGLLTVFIIVGILIIPLGNIIASYTKHFDLIIGIIIIILGALMFSNIQYYFIINPIKSGVGKIKDKISRKKDTETGETEPVRAKKASVLSLFGYGIGYGAASLGCTLPLFITIIITGMGSGGILNGILILLAFSVSASVLMIVITLLVAGFEMALMQKLKIATQYIKKASGVILIVVGIYLLYYYWTVARFL